MRSRPSSPLASRLSTQASSAAKSGTPSRLDAAAAGDGRDRDDRRGARRRAAGTTCAGDERRGRCRSGDEGRCLLPANTVTLLSASIRTAISAPTRLSRSARIRPVISPGPGNSDLGLRRARHDRAVGVAHHDVADAQRRATARVALELRAADLDLMAVAEILLDRRGQPRRGEIELDRAARQPPPQGRASRRARRLPSAPLTSSEFAETTPTREEPQAPMESLQAAEAGA